MSQSSVHSRRRLLQAALAACAGAGLPLAAQARSATRSALVIGNARYALAPLANPVNDARLVAATLAELGFDVRLIEDGDLRQMLEGVRNWVIASRGAQVRAFFFAGHGTQYRGDNYLVPVDMTIIEEREIERAALRLSDLIDALSAQPQGVNFVIVDACRNEPAALLARDGSRTRSVGDPLGAGFAPEEAPRGTVVAYSTSPGALAADGRGSANSVFTRALATYIREPGLPVETLFKRVRVSVMRETRNAQVPWERSSLVGDFCFRPGPGGGCGR